jgi:hypothetical protein
MFAPQKSWTSGATPREKTAATFAVSRCYRCASLYKQQNIHVDIIPNLREKATTIILFTATIFGELLLSATVLPTSAGRSAFGLKPAAVVSPGVPSNTEAKRHHCQQSGCVYLALG